MKTTIKVARVECGSQVDETSQVEREVTYSPDEVTVTTTTNNVLYTKRLTYEGGELVGKSAYDNAFWHKVRNESVGSYEELYGLLMKLSGEKKSCVIRGQVFDCHQGETVQRTRHGGWKVPKGKSVKEAQTAYFAGVPRRWLCVDVDGDDSKGLDCFVYAPVVSGEPAEVAHLMAHWLVNVWLPEPFRNRRAVVQFSSSFWANGVSSKVKAHVWFLLDEAVGAEAIREAMWLAYVGKVAGDGKPFIMGDQEGQRRLDGSTARVTQPNFTASPLVIEDGVAVPDKHAEYRIIEVNKRGDRVVTANLLADLEAAKETKVAHTVAGGGVVYTKSKTENKSDAAAQLDITTWSPKDHADYKLAKEALTFLGASHYDHYDPWLEVGMCLHYRFPGQEGLVLWTEWSKQSSHFTEGEVEDGCAEKWGTFNANVENPKTLGKLFGMASDKGFVLPSKKEKAVGQDGALPADFDPTLDPYYIDGIGLPDDYGKLSLTLEDIEQDNMRRLKNAYGSKLRYITERDEWAVFCDGRWSVVKGATKGEADGIITRMMSNVIKRMEVEGREKGLVRKTHAYNRAIVNGATEQEAKEKGQAAYGKAMESMHKWKRASDKASCRKAMLSLLAAEPQIRTNPDDWDSDIHLIGTPDGVVDLHTGEMRPYDAKTLILRSTRARLQQGQGHDLPGFVLDAIHSMMGNPGDEGVTPLAAELAEYLLDIMAYCLTGDTSREKFMVWYGALGGNGKSTLQKLMEVILGPVGNGGYYAVLNEATVTQSKQTAGAARPDVMDLMGARLAVVTDFTNESGVKLDVGFIKAVTGRDTISARALFKGQVNFRPMCKLLLACNDIPRFAADGGMTRRFEALPFKRTFKAVPLPSDPVDPHRPAFDPHLGQKLEAHRDAIFTHLVWRATQLAARGYEITPPSRVTDFSTETLQDMNPLKAFISECCQPGDERVAASKLLSAYKAWRRVNGGRDHTPVSFASEMERLGYQKVNHSGSKFYTGLRLMEHLVPRDTYSPI